MKKILLTLLAVIVIVGALAGAGYAGYRFGYTNGLTGSGNAPVFGHYFHMDPDEMPMYRFGNGFDRGFGFNNRPMMRPGGFRTLGFGYFSPFLLLWRVAIIALILWFAYWLFTKNGWQITRKTDTSAMTDTADSAGN